MSEFEYSQMATLMGEIVDEAIAASMEMVGFHGSASEGFEGTFGGGSFIKISPLGGRYEGSSFVPGGQARSIPDGYPALFLIPGSYGMPFEDLQGMVDYWWGEVNGLFDTWWQMPQPQNFADQVALAQRLAQRFAYGEDGNTGPGVDHFGRNENLDDIQTIQNRVSNMDGAAMLAFESSFANKIDDVVNAQGAAACVSWGCIAGEQEIWARAQEAIADIAGKGRNAMTACRGGGANVQALIRVVGAILSVSGSVLTVGIKVALSVAGTLTGLGASFVPPPEEETEVPLGADTPFGVIDNIREALEKLSSDIRKEEQWIADAANGAAQAVAQDQNRLATPGLVDETDRGSLYPAGEILAEYATIKSVANDYMRNISAEIKSAGDTMSGVDSGPWDRPGEIGRGRTGGFSEWNALNAAISAAASETALSINQAADALVIIADDFAASDEEVRADMAALAELTREQNQTAGF